MIKSLLGAGFILLLLFSIPSAALDFWTGNDISIPKDTIVNDNLFVAGDNITIAGDIKGNLYAFGGKIKISGIVYGSIIAMGGEIAISGTSKDMLVAGGNITMNGIVRKDFIAAGGQINIFEDARIGKDAFIGCGDANIAGKIYRDLKIGAGNIMIASSALIKGKLDYTAQNISIADNKVVQGTITAHAPPKEGKQLTELFAGFVTVQRITSFLAILLIGILVIKFLPNQVKLVTSKMTGEIWKSLGWGLLSLIVIPLLAILLCVTLIGFPLGMILGFAYAIGLYLTTIFISIVVGKWILDKITKRELSLIWAFIIGLITVKIITLIPIVGWIVGFILFLWAFGALVSTRFVYYKQAREAQLF